MANINENIISIQKMIRQLQTDLFSTREQFFNEIKEICQEIKKLEDKLPIHSSNENNIVLHSGVYNLYEINFFFFRQLLLINLLRITKIKKIISRKKIFVLLHYTPICYIKMNKMSLQKKQKKKNQVTKFQVLKRKLVSKTFPKQRIVNF